MGLEHADISRRGKLIWAVEVADGPVRLSCSECSESSKTQRGCHKPGECRDGSICFRTSSPMLHGTELDIMRECPVGYLLREAPWAFDAVRAYVFAESAGFTVHQQSQWLQDAINIVSSEKERHRQLRQQSNQTKSDASYASRVLRG